MSSLGALLLLLAGVPPDGGALPTLVVGSKMDVEGGVLAEIFSQVIEGAGEATVVRRFNMGGTGLVFAALDSGNIDLFPEYTGTLSRGLLHQPELTDEDVIRQKVAARGYWMGRSLGFNNTYALGLKRSTAQRLKIATVGDLKAHPELTAGFSPEFVSGDFGWPGLQKAYGLKLADVRSMEHTVAYKAVAEGSVDLTDAYTTDATLAALDLVVLEDDQHFFPRYEGLALARAGFDTRFPRTVAALQKLDHVMTDARMMELNARAELKKEPLPTIARDFLATLPGLAGARPLTTENSRTRMEAVVDSLPALTLEHAGLVLLALLLSLLVAVPLGILGARRAWLRQLVVATAGLLQTVPSVALLCFLIPLLGVGARPALVALFLYGLFPIVRGVTEGLCGLDARYLDVAHVLGMNARQRLLWIEMPLASGAIMNGIQVSAVTNVGTATLAALIGGGGYGTLIVQGLAMNDNELILYGAVPSALMALVVHGLLEGVTWLVVPTGLRKLNAVRVR